MLLYNDHAHKAIMNTGHCWAGVKDLGWIVDDTLWERFYDRPLRDGIPAAAQSLGVPRRVALAWWLQERLCALFDNHPTNKRLRALFRPREPRMNKRLYALFYPTGSSANNGER